MSKLPPVLIPGAKRVWSSPGPLAQPPYCSNCQFQGQGYGFCPDAMPEAPKVALIFSSPLNDDLNEQAGMSGKMGWFVYQTFISPFFRRDECIISHVLRCRVPFRKGRPAWPVGVTKKQAERTCRKYDAQHGFEGKLVSGGIAQWSPDMFVITFDPRDTHQTPAYVRQIQRHVGKARRLVDAGYKVAILFGKEACAFYAGFTQNNGGLKDWAGHHFAGPWTDLILTDQEKEVEGRIGFKQA